MTALRRTAEEHELRLQKAILGYANQAITRIGAVLMGIAVVVSAVHIATFVAGDWEAIWAIAGPGLVGALALYAWLLARRGRVNSRRGYAIVLVGSTIPGLAAVSSSFWVPLAPAQFLLRSMWLLPVAIACSALFLDRTLCRLMGLWCGAQSLILVVLARPALLEMASDEPALRSIVGYQQTLIRLVVFIALGFLIGYMSDLARQITLRVFDEEQRATEQDSARARAEEASEAKSELLAHMSHELRTPLNAILGHAQILLADADLEVRQRDAIETMQQSGRHLLGLVDELLDMATSGAGQLEAQSIPAQGSTFRASLPLRATARDAKASEEAVDKVIKQDAVPQNGPLCAPSTSKLAELRALTERGNMRRLRHVARQLAKKHPRFAPLADALCTHASAFDDAGALALLDDLGVAKPER